MAMALGIPATTVSRPRTPSRRTEIWMVWEMLATTVRSISIRPKRIRTVTALAISAILARQIRRIVVESVTPRARAIPGLLGISALIAGLGFSPLSGHQLCGHREVVSSLQVLAGSQTTLAGFSNSISPQTVPLGRDPGGFTTLNRIVLPRVEFAEIRSVQHLGPRLRQAQRQGYRTVIGAKYPLEGPEGVEHSSVSTIGEALGMLT